MTLEDPRVAQNPDYYLSTGRGPYPNPHEHYTNLSKFAWVTSSCVWLAICYFCQQIPLSIVIVR